MNTVHREKHKYGRSCPVSGVSESAHKNTGFYIFSPTFPAPNALKISHKLPHSTPLKSTRIVLLRDLPPPPGQKLIRQSRRNTGLYIFSPTFPAPNALKISHKLPHSTPFKSTTIVLLRDLPPSPGTKTDSLKSTKHWFVRFCGEAKFFCKYVSKSRILFSRFKNISALLCPKHRSCQNTKNPSIRYQRNR